MFLTLCTQVCTYARMRAYVRMQLAYAHHSHVSYIASNESMLLSAR